MSVRAASEDGMKVVREDEWGALKPISMQLSEVLIERINDLAKEHDIPRQKLIELILRQVVSDKNFVLRVKG